MDSLSSSNRESYCRVQNQISFEETNENVVEDNSVINRKCKCSRCEYSKELSKWIKVLATIAILALLLSAAAVSMVTVHWMMAGESKDIKWRECTCPPFTDDNKNLEETSVYPEDLANFTEVYEECPDCRMRRDGTRASLLHPGHRRSRNYKRCNRACRGELDVLSSSIRNEQNTAIHFNGFPPGMYELGQDGAYRWWRPSAWYSQMSGFYYNHSSGHVVVMERGLYFIYSQVEHPANHNQAHVVMVNDTVFLRCVKSVPSSSEGLASPHDHSSCYLGGTTVLDQFEEVWIKASHTRSHVQVTQASSYWGIVRLRSF